MQHYAVVKPSGEILRTEKVAYQYIECDETVDDVSHYYDLENKSLEYKEKLYPLVVGEGLTLNISNLPEGLKVETNGMGTITDNEPLVIEYDVPGTYTISFSGLVNYLDHEMEVTVG